MSIHGQTVVNCTSHISASRKLKCTSVWHPSHTRLPCVRPWLTARPSTGLAGGLSAPSPLLSSHGSPRMPSGSSTAAPWNIPAPSYLTPLSRSGRLGASIMV